MVLLMHARHPAMNKNLIVSASSAAELIDAKLAEHQMSGSNQCPSCSHKIEQMPDWVGLPAGVKFDPTDQELIEHLEAKVSTHGWSSHPLIDEFIPTIEGEDGICYTHPEKLPGVTRDGLSKHFFHRPSKAYTTGTRKRRKIQMEVDVQQGETRWHKTGKTRPIIVKGKQKGCKKILVLYTNFGKCRKPEKTNWVMHQYHLGEVEEEKEGELVVSKIFYQTQPRQCNWSGVGVGGGMVGEHRRKDSGSCCLLKDVVTQERDEHCSAAAPAAEGLEVYSGIEQLQHNLKQSDNFSFAPFARSFHEVRTEEQVGTGETSAPYSNKTLMVTSVMEEHNKDEHRIQASHELQHHNRQQAVATIEEFSISRPTNPVSAITSPVSLHQTSILLNDPFNVSRILFHTDTQQQQQQEELMKRSGISLDEFIMGCTSTNTKTQETSNPDSQETEWLKHSYWSPHNQDHHR